jgi:hypothetical protein
VAERRGQPERGEVRLLGQDEPPVGDVRQRGERVAPQRGPVDRHVGDRGQDADQGHHQPDGGEQATRPAQPEPAQVDAPRAAALQQQERRDQEPRDDEEDVDAEEAAGHQQLGRPRPAHARVLDHDGEDCDSTQPVERRAVLEGGAGVAAIRTVGGGVVEVLVCTRSARSWRQRSRRVVDDGARHAFLSPAPKVSGQYHSWTLGVLVTLRSLKGEQQATRSQLEDGRRGPLEDRRPVTARACARHPRSCPRPPPAG